MRELPFVVRPKAAFRDVEVGTEESGIIKIQKRGYLTVAEKSFVDGVTQGSDGMSEIVTLAKKGARKYKKSTEEMFNVIMDTMSGNITTKLHAEVDDDFGRELSDIAISLSEAMQRRSLAASTILIQSRINPEWTVEDTVGLHPDLLEKLLEFYNEEEAKVPPKAEEPKDEIEEAAQIVGK